MSADRPIVLDSSSMEEDAALETATDSVHRAEEERTPVRANASRPRRASTRAGALENDALVPRVVVPRKSTLRRQTLPRISVPSGSHAHRLQRTSQPEGLVLKRRSLRPRRGRGERGFDRYVVADIEREEGTSTAHLASVFGIGMLEFNGHSRLDKVYKVLHARNLSSLAEGGQKVLQLADRLVQVTNERAAIEAGPSTRDTGRRLAVMDNDLEELKEKLKQYENMAMAVPELQRPRNQNLPGLPTSDCEPDLADDDESDSKPAARTNGR